MVHFEGLRSEENGITGQLKPNLGTQQRLITPPGIENWGNLL